MKIRLRPSARLHLFTWSLGTFVLFVWPSGNRAAALAIALGASISLASLAAVAAGLQGWRRVLMRFFLIIVGAAVLSLTAIQGLYAYKRGELGDTEIRAVAQTNPHEAWSYIFGLATVPELIILSLFIVALAMTIPRHPTNSLPPGRIVPYAALTAVAGGLLFFHGAGAYYGPFFNSVVQHKAEVDRFRKLVELRRQDPVRDARSDFSGTVVVVIGESITRNHMGLYGYWRDTTPALSSVRDQLHVYSDVVSSHSHTVPALMPALTSSGARGDQDYFGAESVDIVSLARAAGFSTHWLSNQNEFGLWDNPVSVLAKGADYTRFFSETVGRSFKRTVRDDAVLPELEKILGHHTEVAQLVFVHLFSAHWPYCDNYSPQFALFSNQLDRRLYGARRPASSVNCYDNSIVFVDWLIARIIGLAHATNEPVAVLFVSDHGEAPLLGTGHESSEHSSYHVEIPLILAVNDAFRKRRSGFMEGAAQNLGAPYNTARLFHALADLMEIRHPVVEAESSLFSESYQARDRVLLDDRIDYDNWSPENDYRENTRAVISSLEKSQFQRVWAHRTNSIGAILEAARIFSGVEIDVVFRDDCGCFKVFHEPAPDTGLTLEDLLSATSFWPDLGLWIDWKNASPSNVDDAVSRLETLDEKYGIKGRVLVETGSDAVWPNLVAVSKAGFRHGYYLPTVPILSAMQAGNRREQQDLAENVINAVQTLGVEGVTFDWRLKPFVDAWLLEFLREHDIRMYSWDLSVVPAVRRGSGGDISARLTDARLEVLLVRFPSDFGI